MNEVETLKRLFLTYLDSIEEGPGDELARCCNNMIFNIVQTEGKQYAVQLVEKWCEWLDNKAQIQGEEADPELLPELLSYIEDCAEGGKKETS